MYQTDSSILEERKKSMIKRRGSVKINEFLTIFFKVSPVSECKHLSLKSKKITIFSPLSD